MNTCLNLILFGFDWYFEIIGKIFGWLTRKIEIFFDKYFNSIFLFILILILSYSNYTNVYKNFYLNENLSSTNHRIESLAKINLERNEEFYNLQNQFINLKKINEGLLADLLDFDPKNNKKLHLIEKISELKPHYEISKVIKAVESALITDNPELVLSIAIKESDLNPTIIGDHGASLGLGQIQPKHWNGFLEEKTKSKVTRSCYFNPNKNMIFTYEIIKHILSENNNNEKISLRIYNGGNNWRNLKTEKYSNEVLKIKSILESK